MCIGNSNGVDKSHKGKGYKDLFEEEHDVEVKAEIRARLELIDGINRCGSLSLSHRVKPNYIALLL